MGHNVYLPPFPNKRLLTLEKSDQRYDLTIDQPNMNFQPPTHTHTTGPSQPKGLLISNSAATPLQFMVA